MSDTNTGAAAPQDDLADQFFAYDPNCGFDTYPTAEEAKKAAEESIQEYRDQADEEWPSDVEQVCWGMVLGEAVAVPVSDEFTDYKLTEGAALPAQAVAPVADEPVPASHAREFTDGTRTLLEDCISAVRDFGSSRPEDGETWESWFEAAFDLCADRLNGIFGEHSFRPAPVQAVAPTDAIALIREAKTILARAAGPNSGNAGMWRRDVNGAAHRMQAALDALAAPQAGVQAAPRSFQAWSKAVGGDFARHNCGPYAAEDMTLASMAWGAAQPTAQLSGNPGEFAAQVSGISGQLAAQPADAQADMFWDKDNPEADLHAENLGEAIDYLADEIPLNELPIEVTLMRAKRLPDLRIRITGYVDGEGHVYEVIQATRTQEGAAS